MKASGTQMISGPGQYRTKSSKTIRQVWSQTLLRGGLKVKRKAYKMKTNYLRIYHLKLSMLAAKCNAASL